MLVEEYCRKIAEEFSTIKEGLVCPVKDTPNLCPYGEMCWVHPAETTPEIEEVIYKNYKDSCESSK